MLIGCENVLNLGKFKAFSVKNLIFYVHVIKINQGTNQKLNYFDEHNKFYYVIFTTD